MATRQKANQVGDEPCVIQLGFSLKTWLKTFYFSVVKNIVTKDVQIYSIAIVFIEFVNMPLFSYGTFCKLAFHTPKF